MMSWIAREIELWTKYRDTIQEASLIPWQAQVGKLLMYTDGDVDEAISQAKYQIREEHDLPHGLTLDLTAVQYWQNVIDYLMKRHVNDLILGEENDPHSDRVLG